VVAIAIKSIFVIDLFPIAFIEAVALAMSEVPRSLEKSALT
jgi:hypothetical protein